MTDYTKRVEALRFCANEDNICTEEHNCGYYGKGSFCQDSLMQDAAAAIEELKAIAHSHCVAASSYWEELEELKAQLPKRGKWIKREDDACECSVCGLRLESFVEGIFYNFCPFCGADMRAKMEVQE